MATGYSVLNSMVLHGDTIVSEPVVGETAPDISDAPVDIDEQQKRLIELLEGRGIKTSK